ncbi:sensor histidine kinase [Taibaiella sp. KBW10]|uniref:sensor histidine kinase n=1 Tax=Taibaiella sp. KBW10 TaxID=2153357 RepID=UPI000F5A0745|nr:HAMP domain-containing sensor histidine kinase [Taibaiella sp. KBW10]RQO30757.1 sensor histidine kinase [Taibaiella sp. KBW10]
MIKQLLSWRTFAILFGLAIVAISFYYISSITKEMEIAEKEKVKTTVEGIKYLSSLENNADANFATYVVTQNTTIPMIIVGKNGTIEFRNIDSSKIQKDSTFLSHKVAELKALKQYIVADFGYGKSTIYYGNSPMLEKLKLYPLMQMAIIVVFISIIIIAIFNAQKSLQNQVWVGMSKETAHQMGTPLSSIVGWMELLKDHEENRESIVEMEKDVMRLQLVADRFSKIGSTPILEEENVVPRLQNMVDYMQLRAPKKVSITFDSNGATEAIYLLSGPLFDWVVENLIRNALDAMEGAGTIRINLTNTTRQIVIDICDSGKGIPKTSFKKVFRPGYSTKQRGWGLGLSLAKRIISVYHNGQIFVKNSELGKGTTFRIILTR